MQSRLFSFQPVGAILLLAAGLNTTGCSPVEQPEDEGSQVESVNMSVGSAGQSFFGSLIKHAKDAAYDKAVTTFNEKIADPSTADAICDNLFKRGVIFGDLYEKCQGRIQVAQQFAQGFVEGGAEDVRDTKDAIVGIATDAAEKVRDPKKLAVHLVEITANSPELVEQAKAELNKENLKAKGKELLAKIKDCFAKSKQNVSSDPKAAGTVGAHAAFMVFEVAKAAKLAREAETLELAEGTAAAGARLSAIMDKVGDDICKDLGIKKAVDEVY